MAETQEPSREPKKSGRYNSYLRYSSLAFQLVVTTGVMGWLGYRLDTYLGFRFPAFMLLFSFTAFGWLLYKLYRSITRE